VRFPTAFTRNPDLLVLAIETSSLGGSVALLEGALLVANRPLGAEQRSAQGLLPAIEAVLKDISRLPADIKLIGMTIGPGSFTGLRVGVTAAKTLAYAVGAGVVGFDTTHVIAAQVRNSESQTVLHVAIDAQRQELFSSKFYWQDNAWQPTAPTAIIPTIDWHQKLQPGEIVAGPAIARLTAKLPAGVVIAADGQHEPQAATVGRLAYAAYQRGQIDDFWKLTPAYFRPSAAEEKAKPQVRPTETS
jgi:tRNA threonylcarbamoyladenosine biosynthesis protein TsaB